METIIILGVSIIIFFILGLVWLHTNYNQGYDIKNCRVIVYENEKFFTHKSTSVDKYESIIETTKVTKVDDELNVCPTMIYRFRNDYHGLHMM